jgi:hypothetical protein
MAYDPKTDTGIPTEPGGTLPRPSKLPNAFAAYDAGDSTKDALEAEQEEAVKDSIERFLRDITCVVGSEGILKLAGPREGTNRFGGNSCVCPWIVSHNLSPFFL